MIVVFTPQATEEEISTVKAKIVEYGYEPRIIQGTERTVFACVGDETSHKSLEALCVLPFIENVLPVQKRYKMVSREFQAANSVVAIGGQKVGGGHFLTIAGPCAVESAQQMDTVARDLVAAGITCLRAGAFKPRTSPYAFQGLGEKGLDLLAGVKSKYGLRIVTEVVGVEQVEVAAKVADMLQIGARNCQNYRLLEQVAGSGRPVLLKRGMSATVEEWLLAAEYLIVNGCHNVVLCERGIRTFENSYRFTLDLGAVAVAKHETHLPVIVDPSHPAGRADLVLPLAKAAIGVGADGLIVETHPTPSEACSDAAQQLPSATFADFMKSIQPLIDVCVKTPGTGESIT